jgi:hypothetical protein
MSLRRRILNLCHLRNDYEKRDSFFVSGACPQAMCLTTLGLDLIDMYAPALPLAMEAAAVTRTAGTSWARADRARAGARLDRFDRRQQHPQPAQPRFSGESCGETSTPGQPTQRRIGTA